MRSSQETELPAINSLTEKRLVKLANFLANLPPRNFNFAWAIEELDAKNKHCGTVACAIGWTPAVFPKLVKFPKRLEYGATCYIGDEDYVSVARRLFKLPEGHVDIFCPGNQKTIHKNLPHLSTYAKPKDVAEMLRKYVKLTKTPKRKHHGR